METTNRETGSYRQTTGREQASAGEDLREKGREATERLREETVHRGREFMSQRKGTAAEAMADFADALDGAADQLRSRNRSLSEDLVRTASGSMRQFSRSLQDQDIDGIVRQVQSFSRRQPLLLMGGALLAGFAFTRLLRVPEDDDGTDYRDEERYATRGASNRMPDEEQETWYGRDTEPEYTASSSERVVRGEYSHRDTPAS